ncbi:MAG TPA: hypothetical protein VK177_07205 [Flavobacteriales bacterium]|nr:hypothetical protein [Flavobacteriales bacterium]
MKQVLFIALFLSLGTCFSQGKDTLNQTVNGKKQGWWKIAEPDPSTGKLVVKEEGRYREGKKTGQWKTYYKSGKVKTISNFREGRQTGKFIEYFESGCISEEGEFGGMHYTGTYKMYWENGRVRQEKNFNERGELHGDLTYNYPNGKPEMEGAYENGKPKMLVRYFNNGDVKEKTVYAEKGPETTVYDTRTGSNEDLKKYETDCKGNSLHVVTITDTVKFDEEPDAPDVLILDPGKAIEDDKPGKDSNVGKSKYTDGDYFGPTPRTNKNLTEDGEFKNGKLWNGKKYIYDKNGLILKVEIWKEGKYVADGQLE